MAGSSTQSKVDLKKLKLKKGITSSTFMKVWFQYDKDMSGTLEYSELNALMKDLLWKEDQKLSQAQIVKYIEGVKDIVDAYDDNGDGMFEMNELAKALKIENNFLKKIIKKKTIKDKHIKRILKHYNTLPGEPLEGCELKAFVGDIVRAANLPYTFAIINDACKMIVEMTGGELNQEAIKQVISAENRSSIARRLSTAHNIAF